MSSGREILRSTVDLVRSLPSEPLLLLFDGLDDLRDSSGVLQLVELLAESPAKVIAAARTLENISRRLFRSIFDMPAWTAAEPYDFLRRTIGSVLDTSAIESIALAAGGSPLGLTLLLEFVRTHGTAPLEQGTSVPINWMIENELASVSTESRQDYLMALTALAVLGRAVHVSEYPARRILELQSSGLLTRSDGFNLHFVHALVAEAVLYFARLTADSKDRRLASLEFGAEEAERDSLLSDGFIALPEFSEVLAGKKNIVVGDRGTGKSAMFARLSAWSRSASCRELGFALPCRPILITIDPLEPLSVPLIVYDGVVMVMYSLPLRSHRPDEPNAGLEKVAVPSAAKSTRISWPPKMNAHVSPERSEGGR